MNRRMRIRIHCRLRALLLGVLLALSSTPSLSGCLDQARLTGVNLAGAEFNHKTLPGVAFKDYTYPSAAELNHIAAQGANMIRLPFSWERLQRVANGPLDPDELGRIRTTVNNANTAGLCVLLDVHNYGQYYQYELGDVLPEPAPKGTNLTSAFINFWLTLADEFPDPNKVAFGLMNEPAHIPLVNWAAIAKQTLASLRSAGATNLVFVSGGGWSGVHDWFAGLQNNANEFDDLRDPLKRAIIEVHQYTDPNSSGMHAVIDANSCRAAGEFTLMFERIKQWAQTHQQKLFLGEFGVPQTEQCLNTLLHFLTLMNNDVWHGWSYWAAGSWWGKYPLALSGPNQPEAPQWRHLKTFFYQQESNSSRNPPQPPGPAE